MSAAQSGEYTLGGEWVESTESGACLQFGQWHDEQQFGYALIGKQVAHNIHTGKVKHHTFVSAKQTFPRLTRQSGLSGFGLTNTFILLKQQHQTFPAAPRLCGVLRR